jgi:CRISPR-associated endonuclease Csn1
MQPYRLALDLGANSIGWAVLDLDAQRAPCGLRDLGVRVFPDGRDPQTAASLAAERRAARSARRRRDRYLQRRAALLNELIRQGLMPTDPADRQRVARIDPYALRANALRRRLTPAEFGRAIFHLNQRRGFASNRKLDRGNEEKGKIAEASGRLKTELSRAGAPTLGVWLAERHEARQHVRARLVGQGAKASYDFYPTRDLLMAEFTAIWAAQAAWDPSLTDARRERFCRIIFHQRPLRTPPRGRCWLEPGEFRADRGLPLTQRFRIAQDLAHLRLGEPGMPQRNLTSRERGVLVAKLHRGEEISADKLRKLLGLSATTDLNLRGAGADALKGDETAKRMGGVKGVGKAWHDLPPDVQDRAAQIILDEQEEQAAIAALEALGIERNAAARAVDVTLPDSTASLSAKAMARILPHLEKEGATYDKAVQAAGYAHHSDDRTGEIRAALPYYGEVLFDRIGTGSGDPAHETEKRFGRAPNPTVHVALNQLRHVVNALIARHGPPAQIVVEVLRDLGRSAEQRREVEKEQRTNREANDRRRALLAERGVKVNAANLMRLRLWEEQSRDGDPKERRCPYSGELIGMERLFSAEIEEDHILPFALTLDDSAANRVLVTREANRRKSRQTPHQAFGNKAAEWEAILQRAALLPKQKAWRFSPDALIKWQGEHKDFLARHLTDSSYLARLARFYLRIVCDPDQVWCVPGRLTALLRAKLGLNSLIGKGGAMKDRADHRHHALDALTVGLIDRGLLQRVTRAAKQAEESGRRLIDDLPEPWPGFVAAAREAVERVVVSHRPDHGTAGKLHNETAYGAVRGAEYGGPNVVVRKPIASLAAWSPADAQAHVRDPLLAARIAEALGASDAKTRQNALADMRDAAGANVRRIRTWERLEGTKAIADRATRKTYRVVKLDANHRVEFWRLPAIDGKPGRVVMQAVPLFNAAADAEAKRLGRPVADRRPHPAARLMMRLHKNDMVAFGVGAERQILRVVKFRSNQVNLAPHNEAGNLKARDADKADSFKYVNASIVSLARAGARKVYVSASGQVSDNGPLLW